MNDYYYFNSKKYIFLLIIICTLFFIFVVKTFDYLPNYSDEKENYKNYTGSNVENTIKYTEQKNDININAEKEVAEDSDRHKSGHIDFYEPQKNETNYEISEEVKAPAGALSEDLQNQNINTNSVVTNDEQALKCILNAKRLKSKEDYANAVKELLKISELTNDNELLAMSYEEIANIYAQNEKYHTALSFAYKANQASPSFAREVLIAKIYYKSGNAENAITRINKALKKDFK